MLPQRVNQKIEIRKSEYQRMVKTIQDLKAQIDKLEREHPDYQN